MLNIPHPGDTGGSTGTVAWEESRGILELGRKRLFEDRERRVKPARDEKVLTAWNGLMLRSFAEAASALDRADYRRVAVQNGEFLTSCLRRDGRLLRSWKNGDARLNGYLEDYACLIDGLVSLYEATFDVRWVDEAERLATVLVEDFWDPADSNFYFTSRQHESLIHRPKDLYDNATPAGNSVAAHALLRLAGLTGKSEWAEYARAILSGLADLMASHPSGFSNYLCALDFLLSSPREIAIKGDPASIETRLLLKQVFERYLPGKVVACGCDERPYLLRGRAMINGQPTAYVCHNSVCGLPATTPEELGEQLFPALK